MRFMFSKTTEAWPEVDLEEAVGERQSQNADAFAMTGVKGLQQGDFILSQRSCLVHAHDVPARGKHFNILIVFPGFICPSEV